MAHGTRARWGKVPLDALVRVAPNMTAATVYAYLCCHSNPRGESWPDNESIATDLGVSVPTVRRALAVLLELEVVVPRSPGRFLIVDRA